MLSLNYKTIIAVALPIMGASFVQSIVLLTDSAFLTRYSTDAFAAVGNAGLIYISMFMFVAGISDGAQILISRKIGENKEQAIGSILGTSIVSLSIIIGLLFLLTQLFLPDLIYSYAKHPEIAQSQIDYLTIRNYGLFFSMIMMPIQAYYFAYGRSWIPLMATVFTAVGNIILDYGLIFGKLGFPEMGLKGAALATASADGLSALFLVSYFFLSKEHVKTNLFHQFKHLKHNFLELLKALSPYCFSGNFSAFNVDHLLYLVRAKRKI